MAEVKKIAVYDTTLRDGAQSEDINLNLADKLKIALKLDELGIDCIEGGWPGANPVDDAFFAEIRHYELKHSRVAAFGSTHHPASSAEQDPTLNAMLASGAPILTIFGKTWDLHATEALRVPPEKNLDIIRDSVAYLKQRAETVYFDAEHFFDGFKRNPAYALAALKSAQSAGADLLVLCDTNGGTLPHEISSAIEAVRSALPKAALGIHAHNDCELAVANTLAAVEAGASHAQGTMNGVGERCGNANLCSIIPALELKYDGAYRCLPEGRLNLLTAISAYISEVSNLASFSRQPFVGRSAFAHKGGVHVSAVNRNPVLYEHIDPALIGNSQRILITELGGRSNIVSLAGRYGFHLDKDEPVVKGLLNDLKQKASLGYDYAAAEASVELLILRKLARRGVREFFKLHQFRVIEHKQADDRPPFSEATVMVEVEGAIEHTAATGYGPVNALDSALRKALTSFYPRLNEMRLMDFKVRVLSGAQEKSGPDKAGTASNVRVLIESADQNQHWVTVGVSYNIIEASWQALADSFTYKLYKDENKQRNKGQ